MIRKRGTRKKEKKEQNEKKYRKFYVLEKLKKKNVKANNQHRLTFSASSKTRNHFPDQNDRDSNFC